MTDQINNRLSELGIDLPDAPAPAANYAPFIVTGSLVFIAGQLPIKDGTLAYKGRVGDNFGIREGQAAARLCAINILAHLKAACDGDLDRVVRCVRLGGFVLATRDFTEHPKIINGASDLMVEVFGDKGRHARAAVGSSSLPLGGAVEVDGIFEIA